MKESEVKVRCVGLHSLFLDGNQGTRQERHVVFCDLDISEHHRNPVKEFTAFKHDLRRVMADHGVTDAYLFRTLKGLHVFAPSLMSRKQTERFEEDLEHWGSDGFHRFMGYKNGGTVMRVTKKPGEANGPRFVGHVFSAGAGPGLAWSQAHFMFLDDLHEEQMPLPMRGVQNGDADEVRLEHYESVARLPAPAGFLEAA